jgi:hypothetical protein
VWLKDEEVPHIRERAEAVKACLPPDRHDESKWFEPGDEGTGTATVDDPIRPDDTCCVFLQSDRKCALQVVSQKYDLGWPGLKPFYCATYPLYIENGVMMMDDETPIDPEVAMCRRCAPEQRAMFEVHRDEAILILGKDGYRELHEAVSGTDDDKH